MSGINKDTFAKDYVDVAVKDGVQAADAWVIEQNGGEIPDREFIEEMAPQVKAEIEARQEAVRDEVEAATDEDGYEFDNSPEAAQEAAEDAMEHKVVEAQPEEDRATQSDTEASEGV